MSLTAQWPVQARCSLVRRRAFGRAVVLIAAGLAVSGCAHKTGPRVTAHQPRHAQPLPGADTMPESIWLETLDLSGIDQEWGEAQAARSVGGHPLKIGTETFEHGVGTHAASEFTIDLHGAARRLEAQVGVDAEVGERGSVAFVVQVDGKEVLRTPVLHGGEAPVPVSVDLTGAGTLVLAVENGGDNINYDHADWADARLVLDPAAKTLPVAVRPDAGPEPVLAMGTAPEPAIHAPRITGATPGRPFLFRIPATGEGPLHYEAANLPDGLTLDPQTGIIRGSLREPGTTVVEITVRGPRGVATSQLTIVGGRHKLALTPPMGWNSWNVWGTSVDDAKVRAAADWMVRSGLAAHGFRYINIDDAWEGGRDEHGNITTNEKFPDMKALADYVHSKGLKLGIYSSPGPKTCAGFEGSYLHEQQDADTFAAWGIDLIKYDWCSYGKIAKDKSLPELQKPYVIMRQALDNCGRDIVYSLCQYGMGEVWKWGGEVGGNYWRTTGDITDTWSSLSRIGFGQAELYPYAGPGHWNDPDMLVVGKVGWGPSLHDTRLTHNEQVTHITLWSLLAAPLLIGCDMSQMDDFTLALLTNPEVLEVNQDPLGRQARRVAVDGDAEVWARPLADGTFAVGLFNRGRGETQVHVAWSDLGLDGPQNVRDLWRRVDLGEFDGGFAAPVARHGAMMLKVSPR